MALEVKPSFKSGGMRVRRNTQTESGFSDKIFAEKSRTTYIERFDGQTDRQTDLKKEEWG
jgi:hypothetical protein